MSKFNFEALRSRLAVPQRLKPFRCYFMTNNSPRHLQSLPPDVLHEIFERYIDGHRQDQSRFLMRSSKDAPWFLGHVCQLWRETAISTPRLWNHLPPFKFTTENETLRTHPMFEELVKRSGTQLLRIQFDFTYYKGDVSMGIISALRFLIATSERWEELTIRGLNLWNMHNNFNSIGNRIPNLRRVQLLSFCDIFDFMEENDLEEHLDIFAGAPVLSEILFRNLSSSFWRSFPIVPWKQLVKYQNMNGGRGWFYQVLKRAENLETLMAAECNFREDSIEPFEHPRLHHLQAHVDNTPISFLSSLEELKLPALSTLVTTFDPHTSSPEIHAAPVLMSLIIRSQCNLKTLVLSQGPLHDFEILELLAVVPNLETLELGDCVNLNNALSRLEFKQTEPTLLPSLRALTLVFPTTMHPRHVRTILRIAESRKESVANQEDKSSSHLLHPLKCICITIQKADFRYQACLDLNREPAESDIKVSVSAHEAQSDATYSQDVVHSEENHALWQDFLGKLKFSKSFGRYANKQLERQGANAMRLMHVMSGNSNSEDITELKQLSRIICQPLITQTFIATCKWMLTGQKDIVYIPPDHELRRSGNSHNIVFGTTDGLMTLKGYRELEVSAEQRAWWNYSSPTDG